MAATPDGVVTGMALSRIRSRIGLTQEQLAVAVDAPTDTVQRWEAGSRPVTRAKAATVSRLRYRLRSLGATASELRTFDAAQRADDVLAQIVDPEPSGHVLAHEVLSKRTCDLLTWPMTGREPRELGGHHDRARLGAGQRRGVHDALREAAERAQGPRAPMLRRQAGFLLASDPESSGYLRRMAGDELRRLPNLSRWTPAWPVARGLAIAQSVAGDLEPLRTFLAHGVVTDETRRSNLAYYAYWSGETDDEPCSDEFMATDDGAWRGHTLLAALTDSLNPATPYVELVSRSAHDLLASRPHLLADSVEAATRLDDAARRVLDSRDLTPTARHELGEVVSATRRAGVAA